MKKICYVIFIFCVWTAAVKSQSDFRPGYVVLNSGDTLLGEIDYRGDLLMSSVCNYRKDHTKTELCYTPADIISFRFYESKYFISKEIITNMGPKQVFLEFLVKGKLNVYYYRDEVKDHYLIENDEFGLSELPYEEGIKYDANEHPYFYQSTQHFGRLNIYTGYIPEMKNVIADLKKPEHKELIKFAEKYHNQVCKDEKCVIYEKEIPFLNINLEVAGGIFKVVFNQNAVPQNSIHGGLIMHIWAPRTNEKIYLRTGVLFSNWTYEGENMPIFKIPFHIEYLYPRGLVRPKISYGVNVYLPNSLDILTVSISTGLFVKLNNNLFVTLSPDFEFAPVKYLPIIPSKFVFFTMIGGICVGF